MTAIGKLSEELVVSMMLQVNSLDVQRVTLLQDFVNYRLLELPTVMLNIVCRRT